MEKMLLITFLLVAFSSAEPLVFSSGIITSPLASAALVAPAVSPVAPVAPALPASFAAVPFASVSDYRYSYGSSLNMQEYLGVPAVPLPYNGAYTLTDLYFR
ncbi:uncharacterized protein [Battus philenor]|uniref:uncharacterized protein n=1 Tax=Battus philenor TaxID=42288 RepID=UPI0035CEC283